MADPKQDVSDDRSAATGGTATAVAPAAPGTSRRDDAGAGDPLRGLYRMSTTAGLGSGEYVAINTAAVLAAIAGLLSAGVLIHDVLLVIPAAALLLAVIGIAQVGRSNGTQKGIGLAVLGICLAIGFGGLRAKRLVDARQQIAADRVTIAATVDRAEADFKARGFDAVYASFTDGFRERVPPDQFQKKLARLPESPGWGKLLDITVDALVFDDSVDLPATATGRLSFAYDKRPAPVQITAKFQRADGNAWEWAGLPDVFPETQQDQQGMPNVPGVAPSMEDVPAGPAGPEAPEF